MASNNEQKHTDRLGLGYNALSLTTGRNTGSNPFRNLGEFSGERSRAGASWNVLSWKEEDNADFMDWLNQKARRHVS